MSNLALHGKSYKSDKQRVEYDYYATPYQATEALLDRETFAPVIWDPAAGGGHILEVANQRGYGVTGTDIVIRNPDFTYCDFLLSPAESTIDCCDIITNPPYKQSVEFVEQALRILSPGRKVAMLLPLTFLESKKRAKLFENAPPLIIYVFQSRIHCWPDGNPNRVTTHSSVSYAWYVWRVGENKEPIIRWIP